MNRTHWVKMAAGVGAACFITIGMNYTQTDAKTGSLNGYFVTDSNSNDAGTSNESTDTDIFNNNNIHINTGTVATQSAVSTQSAVTTQVAVSTQAAVTTQAAVSTQSAVATQSAISTQAAVTSPNVSKKEIQREKAQKKRKMLAKKWKNTAVAISKDDIINIRKTPSSSGKKIAKMENGDAVKIIANSKDGNWVKVKSGKIEGYVWRKSLVKGGVKVEKLADKYAKTYAELKNDVKVLNLRKEGKLSASIVTQLRSDDVCEVIKKSDKWLKVRVNGCKGYVAKKYTKTYSKFKTAEVLTDEGKQAKSEETISFSKSDEKLGTQIVNYALQFVGNPYVWGGTSLTKGADCSGFVMSVYKKFGYSLPHSSASQANCGKKVDIKDLQPGDLVFYRHGSRIGHVVIYIGNGKAVEAMGAKWGIVKSDLNYSRAYCARRII